MDLDKSLLLHCPGAQGLWPGDPQSHPHLAGYAVLPRGGMTQIECPGAAGYPLLPHGLPIGEGEGQDKIYHHLPRPVSTYEGAAPGFGEPKIVVIRPVALGRYQETLL